MSTETSVADLLTSFRQKLDEAISMSSSPVEMAKHLSIIEAFITENSSLLQAAGPDQLAPHSELIETIIRDLSDLQKNTDAHLDWFAAMNLSLADTSRSKP